MESPKNWNGSLMEAGQQSKPSKCSRLAIQTLQSLPSQRSSHAAHRAAAEAGCEVGLLGNLTLVVFVALSVFMAAVAIHQEERLAPSERQALELRR